MSAVDPAVPPSAGEMQTEPPSTTGVEPTQADGVAGRARSTPAMIGRFKVHRMLGEGGMGVVYDGHDAMLDRAVALKLVRIGEAGAQARVRLLREAQAMAKLSHPNVVPIYEVGEHGDQVFVAMELVAGETLTAWQKRGPHGWREVLEKYVAAGRGLAAAHAQAIVHRDFKPDIGVVTLIAGAVIERWMMYGGVLAMLYLAVALAIPNHAGFGFGVLIVSYAGAAAWRWREPVRPWDQRRGSSSGIRTVKG